VRAKKENHIVRAAFGTHDVALMRGLADFASAEGFAKKDLKYKCFTAYSARSRSVSPARLHFHRTRRLR